MWQIPQEALARYQRIEPAFKLPFNERTEANILNCYILDEAQRLFDGVRGSRFVKRNGTTYHLLNGCVLWYKQLGLDGLPSNFPTYTAQEMMQGSFPFMPKQVLLVVGFQLDAAHQGIRTVEIQRFTASKQMQFCITLEEVMPQTKVVRMPAQQQEERTKTRVRIKLGPEQTALLNKGND